jgi:murein DD-endopeptidase MepM/ murein hydrolase activator NlpD
MPFSEGGIPVWNVTLDRFALSDHMRIGADEGEVVRAGADGRIVRVGYGNRMGNYVVIDHGDGWQAVYGQIAPGTLREGEIIRTGQVLGTVAQPSIFGYYHGPHLHFSLSREDTKINPYNYLRARD